jgi:hypothetical protein
MNGTEEMGIYTGMEYGGGRRVQEPTRSKCNLAANRKQEGVVWQPGGTKKGQ